MKTKTKKLIDLSPDPANLRTHDAKNIAAIKGSLKRFGQQHPIIVNADGLVVAGNGRLEAMREMGWKTCEVVVTELAGVEVTAFAISDNRTAELAGWDTDALKKTLEALHAEDVDLTDIGFDPDMLAEAMKVIEQTAEEGAEPSLALPAEHADADPDRPPHVSDVKILSGDCRERMAEFPAESFTAVVCDPPYELAFMGKKWDASGIAFDVDVWKEALRVLKPGGYLLAFGGTRTYHRLAVAIEDAGFEVRDCFAWMYGSGFPKSHDVGKAIDKAAGAEREVLSERPAYGLGDGRSMGGHADGATATDLAREWDGYGTALKPAYEPCIIARKPLVGTVAENVQAHGCGALNVDGARIGTEGGTTRKGESSTRPSGWDSGHEDLDAGRWPANVLLDEDAACILDGQSGVTKSGPSRPRSPDGPAVATFALGRTGGTQVGHDDQGGASRFFYTAKASTSERSHDGKVANTHATVKPIAVMRYLLNLVRQPKTNRILDPFAGSGTTLIAAIREGLDVVGIGFDPEHVKIIEARIAHEPANPTSSK